MSDHLINQVERIAPLLARFERLDEYYKGVLDAYVRSTVDSIATSLDLVERMQAEKPRAPKRPPSPPTHLRVVASRKEAHRG